MRWQRILRPALGLFAIGFAVWVYVSIRNRGEQPPPAATERMDKGVVLRSQKGQTLMIEGAAEDISIAYQELLSYSSGQSKFIGAHVKVKGRAGRDFEILANEAETAADNTQIDLRGAVKITTSDGLTVETDQATYTKSDGVTRAPGKVTFTRARMKGSSVGASYDQQRDVLWMLDQARISVAPDEKGAGGADGVAGAAG